MQGHVAIMVFKLLTYKHVQNHDKNSHDIMLHELCCFKDDINTIIVMQYALTVLTTGEL